jgi:hypothetical protein
MEIKVSEKFEKFQDNIEKVLEELNSEILGKEIELYEYNVDSNNYDLVNDYKIENLFMWDDNQIVFSFGPEEWDICSINKTDLIKLD